MIDFTSSSLQILSNPRLKDKAHAVAQELQHLKDHFLVFSSGTTSQDLKGYALSKEALFANARAVNEHFNLTSEDVWGLSIPYFHVGGLSVLARAHVLDSKLIDLSKWEPHSWVEKLTNEKVTITTVVPTQIFDLIQNNLKAPATLKFLVVGGDYLSYELENRAKALGWPVIRTFGMTEVCSQLASAKDPDDKELRILPIHQVRIDQNNRLLVKSESLFTLQFKVKDQIEVTYAHELCDEDGYYLTQDKVEIKGGNFTHLGRLDDQIKVSGRLVSLLTLREKLYAYALENNFYGKVELKFEEDERQGKKLVILKLLDIPDHHFVSLFAPLKVETGGVSSFERTALGKLKVL